MLPKFASRSRRLKNCCRNLSTAARHSIFFPHRSSTLGETLDALHLLKECVELHEGFDPAGSPSLKVLKGTKEFDDIVASVHRDFPAVGQSRLAFVTEERDLVPEGLAYNAGQNVYYLSSLNRRKIVKITREGPSLGFRACGPRQPSTYTGNTALIRVTETVWADSWSEATGEVRTCAL